MRTARHALFIFRIKLCDNSAEGAESKLRKLEALLTKGNSNDGNAENYAKNAVEETEDHTAKNVENKVEGGTSSLVNDGLAKGLENKLSKLEVLLTEGNTDNSNAKQNS